MATPLLRFDPAVPNHFIPARQFSFDNRCKLRRRAGNHIVTVFNPAPGGGNSNGVYFTVNRALAYVAPTTGTVLGASTVKKTTPVKKAVVDPCLATDVGTPAEKEVSDLTGNALFGAGGFFPTSLMGWLLLAILILLIIILVRKFLGLEKKYHSTPLKHA